LPLELKQKVSYEILERMRDLGENSNTTEQREALESWRLEKLKDIRSASAQNLSMSDLSNEESRMLKRALELNWRMLMDDIGLWIPVSVWHTEHDDKPENEPEGYFLYTICVAAIFLYISCDILVLVFLEFKML
jgi:hypothetical protein